MLEEKINNMYNLYSQPTIDQTQFFSLINNNKIKTSNKQPGFTDIYGLSQNVLGLRAKSTPTDVLIGRISNPASFSLIPANLVPVSNNQLDIGSLSMHWRNIYASSYFDGAGNTIFNLKTITAGAGSLIANQLNDTFIVSSSDSSVIANGGGKTLDLKVNVTSQKTVFDNIVTYNSEVQVLNGNVVYI